MLWYLIFALFDRELRFAVLRIDMLLLGLGDFCHITFDFVDLFDCRLIPLGARLNDYGLGCSANDHSSCSANNYGNIV